MKRLILLPLALGLLTSSGTALAAAKKKETPSVLVKLTPLKQGSLPRVLTVYGSVNSATSARRTIMAPLSAAVSNIYVRRGEIVSKGAPLVKLEPSPTAVSAYIQAKSSLKVATQLVQRTRSMVASHLATQDQLIQAEKSESDAKAALAALKAQGAGGSGVLNAPVAGIVTAIDTTPGAIVSEGSGLVQLAQPSGLVLEAGAIPNEAAKIKQGDAVKLMPIGGGGTLSAKVLFRGALVEAANGLVPVQISIPGNKALLGEMFRADITVGQVKGYVVPHEAILVNDTGKPYIVQAMNMAAKKVPVQVLGANGSNVVVTGKLNAQAPVVLAGNYQLDDGTKIRLADSHGKTGQ